MNKRLTSPTHSDNLMARVKKMFYERLKELRNEKKISQTKLAQDMGVSSATVSMWEIDLRIRFKKEKDKNPSRTRTRV